MKSRLLVAVVAMGTWTAVFAADTSAQIPQELDLVVNFKGFGSLLGLLLDLKLGSGE